jgi:hypothetical protein
VSYLTSTWWAVGARDSEQTHMALQGAQGLHPGGIHAEFVKHTYTRITRVSCGGSPSTSREADGASGVL